MSKTQEEIFSICDNLGEKEVRSKINSGQWADKRKIAHAQEWLRLQTESKKESRLARVEGREEEALSIARDALVVAKEANEIASSAKDAARDANMIADSALREARESNITARKAKNAAWAAAIAAIISSICAAIAIYLK